MSRFQYKKQSRGPSGIILSLCVFLMILMLFTEGLSSLSDSTMRRQKESLENAVTRSVTYCYTVEGTYPENLDYLKDNYGLIYDELSLSITVSSVLMFCRISRSLRKESKLCVFG